MDPLGYFERRNVGTADVNGIQNVILTGSITLARAVKETRLTAEEERRKAVLQHSELITNYKKRFVERNAKHAIYKQQASSLVQWYSSNPAENTEKPYYHISLFSC